MEIRMKWIERNETKCQIVVAAILALASVMHTGAANPHAIPEIDSGIFSYIGMVILYGGMPYVDVFDHKGPLLYVINALGMSPGSWHAVALFEILALGVASFFIFRMARLRANFFSSLLITALCTWLLNRNMLWEGNFVEEYALPWIAIAAFLFLRFFQEKTISRRGWFAIGFSPSADI